MEEVKKKEYSMVRYIHRRIHNNKNFLCMVTGPVGCLAADTIINTNRNELGRPYRIDYLYHAMNGKRLRNGMVWDLTKPTYVRSFNGEMIKLHKINAVTYSGKKKVYKLCLENGLNIKATSEHRFMTRDNGWIELINLKDNYVMCDTLNSKETNRKRIKLVDNCLTIGVNHPYNINGRIEVHRLIYESRMNNLEFLEYLDILLNEPERCKLLRFINPVTHLIHHRDGCHYNNSIENLELLIKGTHHFKHDNYTNFSQGIPKFSKVISIEECGEEDTYDIECEEPHHNFIANGMVVHNSGKSWTTLSIAQLIDPTFNISRVIFRGRDLMKLINEGSLKPGSVIVWDEAGIDLSNRNWQSVTNKMLNALLQTFRHKNFILFFTVPFNDFIDSASKKLFHGDFETQKIDKQTQCVIIKPKLLQYNANMGKWYRKYLRAFDDDGSLKKISRWAVPRPSEEMVNAYEEAKGKFTKDLNKSIGHELDELEPEELDTVSAEIKKGINVICPECGHKWVFTGLGRSCKCSRCDKYFKIAKRVPTNTANPPKPKV
jgi:hypothetical protein